VVFFLPIAWAFLLLPLSPFHSVQTFFWPPRRGLGVPPLFFFLFPPPKFFREKLLTARILYLPVPMYLEMSSRPPPDFQYLSHLLLLSSSSDPPLHRLFHSLSPSPLPPPTSSYFPPLLSPTSPPPLLFHPLPPSLLFHPSSFGFILGREASTRLTQPFFFYLSIIFGRCCAVLFFRPTALWHSSQILGRRGLHPLSSSSSIDRGPKFFCRTIPFRTL